MSSENGKFLVFAANARFELRTRLARRIHPSQKEIGAPHSPVAKEAQREWGALPSPAAAPSFEKPPCCNNF
jgi:hypothetical protein